MSLRAPVELADGGFSGSRTPADTLLSDDGMTVGDGGRGVSAETVQHADLT